MSEVCGLGLFLGLRKGLFHSEIMPILRLGSIEMMMDLSFMEPCVYLFWGTGGGLFKESKVGFPFVADPLRLAFWGDYWS